MKGKDMILNDFLLWQDNDDSNPNKIIPISFDMYKVLENNLNNLDKNNSFNDSKILSTNVFSSQNQWYKTPQKFME